MRATLRGLGILATLLPWCGVGVAQEFQAAPPSGTIYVLALPPAMGKTADSGTRDLAKLVGKRLRAEGFDAQLGNLAGVQPLEELVAGANVSPAGLVIGVRRLPSTAGCAVAVVPATVGGVGKARARSGEATLGPVVRGLVAEARAEASEQYRKALVTEGRWCDRRPTRTEQYILDGVHAPTVLVSVPVALEAAVVKRMPKVTSYWLVLQREGGRRTRG